MRYARCEGSTVVEQRDMDPPPEHKAHLWKPVVIEGTGSVETTTVEAERVLIVRSAPPVTVSDIVRERERRLSLGFNYPFGDARGTHHIGTTDEDMKGWDEVTKVSQAAIALGQASAPIDIVTNTGPAQITALEWQAILIAAGQARQPTWAKSFALQAMDPIPADYTADQWWE